MTCGRRKVYFCVCRCCLLNRRKGEKKATTLKRNKYIIRASCNGASWHTKKRTEFSLYLICIYRRRVFASNERKRWKKKTKNCWQQQKCEIKSIHFELRVRVRVRATSEKRTKNTNHIDNVMIDIRGSIVFSVCLSLSLVCAVSLPFVVVQTTFEHDRWCLSQSNTGRERERERENRGDKRQRIIIKSNAWCVFHVKIEIMRDRCEWSEVDTNRKKNNNKEWQRPKQRRRKKK